MTASDSVSMGRFGTLAPATDSEHLLRYLPSGELFHVRWIPEQRPRTSGPPATRTAPAHDADRLHAEPRSIGRHRCQASNRATVRPGSIAATNSALLDAIVKEWAELTGIKWNEISKHMTSKPGPELTDHSAQARMTSEPLPAWLLRTVVRTENKTKQVPRVACGARRHRDGQPCQAKSEPGKRRCRFHGGRSTGPRTDEGKARALANLSKGRVRPNA